MRRLGTQFGVEADEEMERAVHGIDRTAELDVGLNAELRVELKALAWCVAIGLLLLWLSLSTGCGQPAEAATAPEPRPVAYVDLTPTTAAYDRVFPGVVETSEHTTLGFEVPGTIAEVHFDVGERFEAGDTLAVLEARPFQIERRRRLANLAGARATLTDLERSQERVSALLEDGAATTAQADSATAARDRAESSRAAAEAAVALAREDLRDTRLVAAYAGTVVARHAEPGQRVRPGEVVVSIEGGAPEIVVAIPESLSARLEVGAEHAVAISGIDEPLSGEIKRIGRAAPGSALFEVALGLPSNLGLRSGSTAEVRLRGGTRNATVSIPVPAFLAGDADDAGFVFVVDDDRVFRVPVRVGAIEGDRIVVSEGLDGDERVAVSGVSFLRDGQGIRLLGEGVSPFLE